MKAILDDYCIGIYDCEHKTAPLSDNGLGYPSIRTPNIGKGRLILEGVNLVTEETWKEWSKRAIPEYQDLILAREAPAGNVAIIPKDTKLCLGQRTVLIKPNRDKIDPTFLCFYLLSPLMQSELLSKSAGSTVPHINVKDIKKLNLHNLPPLPIQRRIASILSAYDDLIENNLKRIKLLEELAQRTYEEWFVKFRINGEQLPVDEKTGLPVGWERKKLTEIAYLTMGQSPKSEFYNADRRGFPFHQGVSNYGYRFPENSTWSTSGVRFAEKGDILFSVRAPVGRLNIAIEKIILGRGLAAIRSRFNTTNQLFYHLQHIFFKDDIIGGGAIFNSVTKSELERIELTCASSNLTAMFDQFAKQIDNQIEVLSKQNQHLKTSRDILLPRLMNGKIKVE
jgi:type I restriction enzyme S subunit